MTAVRAECTLGVNEVADTSGGVNINGEGEQRQVAQQAMREVVCVRDVIGWEMADEDEVPPTRARVTDAYDWCGCLRLA